MINTNELQPGNWVSVRKSEEAAPAYYQLTDSNEAYLLTLGNIEPILLTTEWIVKLGFQEFTKAFGYPYYTKLQLAWGIIPGERDGWTILNTNNAVQQNTLLYVHELQNFYFYSTGERI
jgi:hypothetical protein